MQSKSREDTPIIERLRRKIWGAKSAFKQKYLGIILENLVGPGVMIGSNLFFSLELCTFTCLSFDLQYNNNNYDLPFISEKYTCVHAYMPVRLYRAVTYTISMNSCTVYSVHRVQRVVQEATDINLSRRILQQNGLE